MSFQALSHSFRGFSNDSSGPDSPAPSGRRHAIALAAAILPLAFSFAAPPPALADLMVSNARDLPGLATFAGNAHGDAAPIRRVTGSSTQMQLPGQFAIDSVHGEVLLADASSGRMLVYPLGATGDVAPIRALEGGNVEALTLDTAHDEVFASKAFANRLSVYARTANGSAAPLRTIEGAATLLDVPTSVAYDALHGELFVACQASGSVLVFRRTDHGNAQPLRVLQGSNTRFGSIYGIALDIANDELIVTDRVGAVSFFSRAAHGNVAPRRRIAGPHTTLDEVLGVTMLSNTDVAVTNNVGGSDDTHDGVLVFPRTADGDVAPSRSLGGPTSRLGGPEYAGVISMVLNNGRFFVEATWRAPDGTRGLASAQKITADTGYLWFFSDQNVEAVVKVLDGCGSNGRFWVFAGGLTNVFTSLKVTDLATGQARVYTNPVNHAFQPIQDTAAFATCAAAWTPASPGETETPRADRVEEPAPRDARTPVPALNPSCTGLCLLSNRYQVSATWQTTTGSGSATGVKLTEDTGYLWFFGASNVEVVVKVINGCLSNNRVWVFAGGLTNVQVTLTVHDTLLGTTRTYINHLGTAFQPVQDTQAFSVCS